MKPTFKKTVLDLVEWHKPTIFVITKTRIDGNRADDIIRRLPFDGAYSTETIGHVRGIWLLWHSDIVSMDVLSATEQEIHVLVQVSSQSQSWLLSAIYGSPCFRERCILWENLKMLSVRHNLPWAVMGDFDDVTCEEEKFGGNGICRRRVMEYIGCMDFCNLIDLGFSGTKYTQTNKRDIYDLIQQSLDRVWANLGRKATFPVAMVKHLARINSDHCPLLLSLDSSPFRIGVRPFQFQPIWLSHEEFPSVVREAWEGNQHNVCNAIYDFTNKANDWNRDVFGNIFWKKKNIIARMLGAEKALARNPSQRLIHLHNFLSEELEKILALEEELWCMKARMNWLIQGERNTTFFHISTLNRRSQNKIVCIQNADGLWEEDVDRVKEIFLEGFAKLYSSEQVFSPRIPINIFVQGNRLSKSEAVNLTLVPMDAKILFALNSMKAFKALGLDGLHAGFFQRFWMVVGELVKHEVKQIFRLKRIPPS